MLVKLTPEQIANHWSRLRWCIASSLPPVAEYSNRAMIEVKKRLLSGDMQCWALLDENDKIQAIGTTAIVSDIGTGVYNLLLYSLFSVVPMQSEQWNKGLVDLRTYARNHGCKKIIAYSNVPRIVELVNSLGGRAEFQLITLEV